MANWIYGEDYAGIDTTQYPDIMDNGEVEAWVTANMDSIGNGWYVFKEGVSEMDLIELLEDAEYVWETSYFTYLRSTWTVSGT